MKNLIMAALLLVITACATGADTLEQKYFELKQSYLEILSVETNYKKYCDNKPVEHYCRGVVSSLRKADDKVYRAFQVADAALLDPNHDVAIAAVAQADNAVADLTALIKEKVDVSTNY